MKILTFKDLIDWSRALHGQLARCMKHCASEQQEERAKYLLEYLSDHERALERMVSEFERNAEAAVLNTWLYDYLEHSPITPHEACSHPYATLGFDEICQQVFSFHNEVIDLYRGLARRAEIPEARALMESLLAMEEHEAMRLARQVGRMNDL